MSGPRARVLLGAAWLPLVAAALITACTVSEYPGNPAEWQMYFSAEARAARGLPPLTAGERRAERRAACADADFTGPLTSSSGVAIPPEVLLEGREWFMLYCRACHGELGDGNGPAARGLRPPPRDFSLGTIKFASVPTGSLWLDEDVFRIVKGGLQGTAMLPWQVPDGQLADIIQYLKCFSDRWVEEEPDEAIEATPDPWVGKAPEGITRGKKIYHGLAQCQECHPAYATRVEIADAAFEVRKVTSVEFRDDMYGSVLKKSDEYKLSILPPDLLAHDVRSVRSESELADLYRVIAAGVGGTAMPTWAGVLKPEDIWAMTYYVKSLMDMRDTPAASVLTDELLAPSNVAPPKKELGPPKILPGGIGEDAPGGGESGGTAPAPATSAPLE